MKSIPLWGLGAPASQNKYFFVFSKESQFLILKQIPKCENLSLKKILVSFGEYKVHEIHETSVSILYFAAERDTYWSVQICVVPDSGIVKFGFGALRVR